ncbi:hypothetical protein LBMAG48_08590 [Phycisphaerae bacterium]|jgi:hypothetical protein|nr:hypothetical protein LBMAG48_08590 [Phycisphaerae bacterium]
MTLIISCAEAFASGGCSDSSVPVPGDNAAATPIAQLPSLTATTLISPFASMLATFLLRFQTGYVSKSRHV